MPRNFHTKLRARMQRLARAEIRIVFSKNDTPGCKTCGSSITDENTICSDAFHAPDPHPHQETSHD